MIPNVHTIEGLRAEVDRLKTSRRVALSSARVALSHREVLAIQLSNADREIERLRHALQSARRVARAMATEAQARDVVLELIPRTREATPAPDLMWGEM